MHEHFLQLPREQRGKELYSWQVVVLVAWRLKASKIIYSMPTFSSQSFLSRTKLQILNWWYVIGCCKSGVERTASLVEAKLYSSSTVQRSISETSWEAASHTQSQHRNHRWFFEMQELYTSFVHCHMVTHFISAGLSLLESHSPTTGDK